MLVLKKGKPDHIPVMLGRDVFIRLRPALASEVDDVASDVGSQVVALVRGSEQAAVISALLPDFDLAGLEALAAPPDEDTLPHLHLQSKLDRLTDRLVLIGLVMKCHDGWGGIADSNRVPIAEPDAGSIALLFQDKVISRLCSERIYARLYEEQAEGNGSAASRDGVAKAAAKPALNADPAANAAPLASPAPMESSAPK